MSNVVSLQTMIVRRSLAFAQRRAQQAADGGMNSLVVITRNGQWSETDYEYDPGVAKVIYDDLETPGGGAIAGITDTSGGGSFDIGDEPTYTDSVRVTIPQSAPKNPRINDLVKVVASPDTDIVGRVFRVVDVTVGGRLTASIAMTCTGVAPSRENRTDTP